MKNKENLVNLYFKRINYHTKERKGKGITQTDMKLAQADIRELEIVDK